MKVSEFMNLFSEYDPELEVRVYLSQYQAYDILGVYKDYNKIYIDIDEYQR